MLWRSWSCFPFAVLLMREAIHLDSERRPVASSHLCAVLNSLAVGILTFDRKLDIAYSNDQLRTILELSPSATQRAVSVFQILEGSIVLDEHVMQRVIEKCVATFDTGVAHWDVLLVASCGSTRSISLSIRLLDDDHCLASFEDVTARLAAETSAVELAMRDPLTELPNRLLFEKKVIAALIGRGEDSLVSGGCKQPGGECAVLLIDLDRFKIVNDTLGHPIGDELLRLVSKRLQSMVRPLDILARLGGDEFALLLSPAPEREELVTLAARIVDIISRSYLVGGHLVSVGASVGISIAPHDGSNYGELLRSADLALYDVKKSGRSAFRFFTREMDVRALARRSLEVDLRKALALREFELHYQPQIDLETNSIIGFEALSRWHHPERGVVSPADFIPLAEEIGLITPLGEWVIREACCEAVRWPSGLSIAVNVSPHQFEDASRLVNVVTKALAMSGLPGNRLEIEITESVFLRNEQSVLAALHQLRAMGVRMAMDDFGTGYSSLSQLNSFPFDKIKIDRSFISNSSGVGGENAVVRAITALGVSLGMATIAEGVETAEQLARLRVEGCSSVQGYLFSHPVPADQVADLIYQLSTRRLSVIAERCP